MSLLPYAYEPADVARVMVEINDAFLDVFEGEVKKLTLVDMRIPGFDERWAALRERLSREHEHYRAVLEVFATIATQRARFDGLSMYSAFNSYMTFYVAKNLEAQLNVALSIGARESRIERLFKRSRQIILSINGGTAKQELAYARSKSVLKKLATTRSGILEKYDDFVDAVYPPQLYHRRKEFAFVQGKLQEDAFLERLTYVSDAYINPILDVYMKIASTDAAVARQFDTEQKVVAAFTAKREVAAKGKGEEEEEEVAEEYTVAQVYAEGRDYITSHVEGVNREKLAVLIDKHIALKIATLKRNMLSEMAANFKQVTPDDIHRRSLLVDFSVQILGAPNLLAAYEEYKLAAVPFFAYLVVYKFSSGDDDD